MAKKSDIDELLWYALISANGAEGEDWADDLLEVCRRVYDSNIRADATAQVDKQLKSFEKQLKSEGKIIRDRAEFRRSQIEVFVGNYKSFDEYREVV